MGGPSNNDIVSAFVSVALRPEQIELHGQYIPDVCWAYLVRKELQAKCRATKLRTALEEMGALDTRLATEFQKETFKSIVRIKVVTKRAKHRRESVVKTKDGTKKKIFLCVETNLNRTSKEIPEGEVAFTKYLQQQYNECASNSEAIMLLPSTAPTVETEVNEDVQQPRRAVTPTNDDDLSELNHPSNRDMRELLDGFIKPELLDSPTDLFVDANSSVIPCMRKRFQSFGYDQHKKTVRAHFERHYEEEESRELDLDPTKHPVLTDRARSGSAGVSKAIRFKRQQSSAFEAIVPASNEDRLCANVKSWLPGVLNAHIETDAQLAASDAVKAFAKVLNTVDEGAFGEVCRKKWRDSRLKMTPELQKALVHDSALSRTQLENIRKCTILGIGWNIWAPFEKVKALDAKIFDPIAVDFIENKRKRTCYCRPVDKAFKWSLDEALAKTDSVSKFNGKSDISRLSQCHIVFGGDHGQGAMRMVVTMLLFSEGTVHKCNLELDDDFLCGFIECKKESYNIMKQTIAGPLNESLKRIATAKELVVCKDPDGKLFVEWGKANAIAKHGTGVNIVKAIPVELFHVGDLAYFLLVQGRDGFASHWCARCTWGRTQWQCLEVGSDKIGELWSWELMEETKKKNAEWLKTAKAEWEAEKAAGTTRKKTAPELDAQQRKGLTIGIEPLFDAIPLENTIAGVLHCVDLVTNHIKDMLDAFIDHRLESRPIELLELRWEEADRRAEEREAFQDLTLTKELLEAAKSLDDDFLVKEATKSHEVALKEHKLRSGIYKKAAANARKLEENKACGAMSQNLRQDIDELLASEFHILRSAYHGGDMEGNYCRKMTRHANEVMDAIQSKLLEVPREKRAATCDDAEIRKYCNGFKRMLQYMHGLSHYCYQPHGTITDGEMVQVRELVGKLDTLWRKLARNVPVKVHMWQHLLVDLEQLRGLKFHQEAKIEVAHQIGKKTDLRYKSLAGSRENKIKCAMTFQANLTCPLVKATAEQVNKERSRKWSAETQAKRDQSAAEKKRQKCFSLREILDAPKITDDFSSLLDLAVVDRREHTVLQEERAIDEALQAVEAAATAP